MLPTQTVFALKQDLKRLPDVMGKTSLSKLSNSPESWSRSLPRPRRCTAQFLAHLCPRPPSPHSGVVSWSPNPPHNLHRSTHSCQWTNHWGCPHLCLKSGTRESELTFTSILHSTHSKSFHIINILVELTWLHDNASQSSKEKQFRIQSIKILNDI